MQKKGTLALLLLLALLVALPAVFAADNNSTPQCTDSDGLNYFVKGVMTGINPYNNQTTVIEDTCSFNGSLAGSCPSGTDCKVVEGDCNGIYIAPKTFLCENGCSDGACIDSNANNPSCTDSDGGRNYFVKGTTTGADSFGRPSQATDYCGATNAGHPEDTRYVHEYSCQPNGNRTDEDYLCPNGCKDGACIQDSNSTVCTEEYAPVCGEVQVQCIKAPCFPVKKTFSNKCFAEVAGAKVLYAGECTTTPPECACTLEYNPVCGKITKCFESPCLPPTKPDDNTYCPQTCNETYQTYSNACQAKCAGAEVTSQGECTTTTPAKMCGGIAGIQCPSGFECKLDGDYPDAGGKCVPLGTNCPQLMPPGPDYCKNGKIVTGVDERGCKYANCILPPLPRDFYKQAYWKCGDGTEYKQSSEKCRPAAEWKEMARLTCAKTAPNCPAATATTAATAGGTSSNIVGDFVAGLFGQTAATAVTATSAKPTAVANPTTIVQQCKPGYVADFELSAPCSPNEVGGQCYAQPIEDIKAIKQKCEANQGEVLVTLDPNKCSVYSCIDKNAVAANCMKPGDVPNEKKLSCLNSGGVLSTKVNDQGCITFMDCVGASLQGTTNTAVNTNLISDKATLLGLALKIESVKMELEGVSAKLDALAGYYNDKGESNSAARFSSAKTLLEGAGTKLDGVKQQIKDKIDSFTESDIVQIRDTVRGIVDDTLKQVLLAILG